MSIKGNYKLPQIPGSVVILGLLILIHLLSEMGGFEYDYACCSCSTPILSFIIINLYFTAKVLIAFSTIFFYDDFYDAAKDAPKALWLRILMAKVLPRIKPIIKEMTLIACLLYAVLCYASGGEMLQPGNLLQAISFYSAEFIFISAVTAITVRQTLKKRGYRLFRIGGLLLFHFAMWFLWMIIIYALPDLIFEKNSVALYSGTNQNLIKAFDIQLSALYFHMIFYLYCIELYFEKLK